MGNQNLLFHIIVKHNGSYVSYRQTRSDLHNKVFTILQLKKEVERLNIEYMIGISLINDYTDIDCINEICALFSTFVDQKNFCGFAYKHYAYKPTEEEIKNAAIKTEHYVKALKSDMAYKIKDTLNEHYMKVIGSSGDKHIATLLLCEKLVALYGK